MDLDPLRSHEPRARGDGEEGESGVGRAVARWELSGGRPEGYVGSVKVGPDPLSRSLRILSRLFLLVLVVLLCSAAHAPGAEGQEFSAAFLDRSWSSGEVYEQRLASFLRQTYAGLMRLPPGGVVQTRRCRCGGATDGRSSWGWA